MKEPLLTESRVADAIRQHEHHLKPGAAKAMARDLADLRRCTDAELPRRVVEMIHGPEGDPYRLEPFVNIA